MNAVKGAAIRRLSAWACLAGLTMAAGAAHAADVAGRFDYYVLSLSWSPTYCLTHPSDKTQCAPTKGYGFVLHGLWPQYQPRGYPQFCSTSSRLTGESVLYAEQVFPSPGLISHEWSKHGTCTGMSALDYFKTADRASASIKVPPLFDAPAKPLTLDAATIVRSFTKANPGMSASSFALSCEQRELVEVRVCLSKTLAPQACSKDVKTTCSSQPIKIPSVR